MDAHRKVWQRKRAVRLVYERWFRLLRGACAAGAPVVELGCGPGLLKAQYPDVVATDTAPNPYADRVVDAAALPFDDGTVANLLLLDVFHHLPEPVRFLHEASRALRPGGRVVMIEPWLGWTGRVFFRHVHHEECDLAVDPMAPWDTPDKHPMRGNVALPYLFFRPQGHLERMRLPLAVRRREPFMALPWLLSGGFQPFSLIPAGFVGAVEQLDRLFSLAAPLTATRCLLVIEREESARE